MDLLTLAETLEKRSQEIRKKYNIAEAPALPTDTQSFNPDGYGFMAQPPLGKALPREDIERFLEECK